MYGGRPYDSKSESNNSTVLLFGLYWSMVCHMGSLHMLACYKNEIERVQRTFLSFAGVS